MQKFLTLIIFASSWHCFGIDLPSELQTYIPFDQALIIDFSNSFNHPTNYGFSSRGNYDFYKSIYERNYFSKISISKDPLISKIIHIVWLGSDFPSRYNKNLESWKALHPDWEIVVWNDEKVEKLPLINRDLYNLSKNYGQRSDIVRLELLNMFGGVYADVDILALKPFDILHHCYDFYTAIPSAPGPVVVANGLIGAAKNHPIIKHAVMNLKNNVNRYGLHNDIMNATGPYYLTRCINEIGEQEDTRIFILPCSFIYPSPNTLRTQSEEVMDSYIRPESFTNHYWTCSWTKPAAQVR